ncbi:MAG: hypothetical protein DHS20C18_31450 [Saprospiraceae bacterium]|nr:MAG: hypothetical protein DHS20C18_31450 [Saprospiraceae bacterium]
MLLAGHARTQAYELRILTVDQSEVWENMKMEVKKEQLDSLSMLSELQRLTNQLHQDAYLEASIDTLAVKDSLAIAFLHLGPQYEWVQLKDGNVGDAWLDQVGFRERLYRGKPFTYGTVARLQERLLTYAENNGYPFAKVWLDSIVVEGVGIRAQLFMDKGPLILISRIEVKGNARLSKTYLTRYLGIREGIPFDKAKILRIRDRIRELPFVQAKKDVVIQFRDNQAILQLELERKNASRFDFLIGVLPNSQSTGSVLITGSFEGELQNQFGLGEKIYAQFEQLRPQTQELNLAFNYPYVLDLPIGVDLDFSLYKRDTNYLDIGSNIGLQYLLEGANYVKAFWHNQSSILLTVDTQQVKNTGQLPDTLDVRRSFFGLEYLQEQLDYRFNPRKGWSVKLRAGAGTKRIKRNNQIAQLDIEDPYSDLKLKSFQYKVEGQLAGYLPLFKTSTFKTQIQGGFLIADEPVYANEQYRIGGNKLLRGFDEEFIFATNYAILTLEYRLLLGQNSYLYLFGDYARVDNKTAKTEPGVDTVDFPYGFGAGITFETKAGIFGLSLAFGTRQPEPIDFGSPKVHFGYVSLF